MTVQPSNDGLPHASAIAEEHWLDLRVAAKAQIATDIWHFELEDARGASLPVFTAGAHLTLMTPRGQRRNYSLCGFPSDRANYQLAIKRDAHGRGGSRSMIDDVEIGTVLRGSEPRNHFALHPRATSFLFIAGGIGITPILSMMRQLRASGQSAFRLIYCTRDRAGTAFAEVLEAEFAGQVLLHHDGGDASRGFDFWPLLERPSTAHIYCCGPTALMDSVADMSGHWPSGAVHFERFGVATAALAADRPFVAHLRRSNVTVNVGAQESLLDALRRAGAMVRSSCESGVCGACKTGLISGAVEHRDQVLTDAERAHCLMPCVSRAASTGIDSSVTAGAVELALDL